MVEKNPGGKKRPLLREEWFYAAIYFWGTVWAVSLLLETPAAIQDSVHPGVLVFWMSVTMLGSFLASTGIMTRNHLGIELLGVYLLSTGPFTYALTQFVLATQGVPGRWLASAFTAWMSLFFLKRLVYLTSRLLSAIKKKPESDQ